MNSACLYLGDDEFEMSSNIIKLALPLALPTVALPWQETTRYCRRTVERNIALHDAQAGSRATLITFHVISNTIAFNSRPY